LHCDEEGKGIEQEYWEQEPLPLRSEVARAIRQTASRKATGPDEVPPELFKAGGETVLDRMHRICVAIWETGEWPEKWTFSTFIPLSKEGDLKQCANYRTVALVSHAGKIVLRIHTYIHIAPKIVCPLFNFVRNSVVHVHGVANPRLEDG